jgi:hypothetical protein
MAFRAGSAVTDETVRYCRCGVRLARDNRSRICRACQRRPAALSCAPEVPEHFWDNDQLRDALSRQSIGEVSRAYRHHPHHGARPLPQERLAEWLGITQTQLSRIECGVSRVRDLDRLTHWAQVLRIPMHLLWFLPSTVTPQEATTGPVPDVSASATGALRRRQFLAGAASAVSARSDGGDGSTPLAGSSSGAVPLSLAPHAPSVLSSQGASALDGGSVAAALIAFRAADRQVGGGHLYATVVRYLQTEVGPRLFGSVRDESGAAVFRAAAVLTDMAGWMAHDAGQDGLAEQHFVRALDLAKAGGDRELEAHIFASMSHLALHLGRPDSAVQFARAGWESLRLGQRSVGLEARLAAMEARGLAARHELVSCDRLLGRAEHVLGTGSAGAPSDWSIPFDAGSLAGEAALCLRQLGRLVRARQQAERVIALRTGDRARSRAFAQLTLAAVLTEQGEVGAACAVGREVLRATGALSSARVTRELQALRRLLERYRASGVVRGFLDDSAEELRVRAVTYRWLGGNIADGRRADEDDDDDRAQHEQTGQGRWPA